jgi:hypothetical protein
MNKMTKITRAETTCVERNWRQSAGGRVLTFDMMLEMTESPKVAALGRDSEVVFDDKRYVLIQKKVVREASPHLVRLVLERARGTERTWSARSRQSLLPASFSRVGCAPPLASHVAVTSTFRTPAHNSPDNR